MNRTNMDATVKRFHDDHIQLRVHLTDFVATDNFARWRKTLGELTIYKYICKIGKLGSDRFILNPIHLMTGLNAWSRILSQELEFEIERSSMAGH